MNFTHLILSTDSSIKHSILDLDDVLRDSTVLKNIDAFCVTDANNCFSAINLSLGTKRRNIKAIYGCSVMIKGQRDNHQLYLLAKSPQGYKSLMHLLSYGITKLHRVHGMPLYDFSDLQKLTDVICITGGMRGELGHSMLGYVASCNSIIERYLETFGKGNVVIDVHRLYPGDKTEELYNKRACYYADLWDIPIVATNYVLFKNREDFMTHEIKYAINAKTLLYGHMGAPFSPEQYFKTAEEMQALFADMPHAISNIAYVTAMCNVAIPTDKLPTFPCSHIDNNQVEDKLRFLGMQGLELILKNICPSFHEQYQQRLEYEMNIICTKGYAHYFIMVEDTVDWARKNNIPVGPGRGSGGGSLLAYSMGITNIDPIAHGLMFERFLNLERSSFVDFDIDFCVHGRADVIKYIKERHSQHNAAQIISYSRLAPRAAIRSICRVHGISFPKVSAITEHISAKPFTTLKGALQESEVLRQHKDKSYVMTNIFKYAELLQGIMVAVTRHAAGVLVSHCDIKDMGVYCCEGDEEHIAIQWDKDALEHIGFLKMDLLGLRTLTSMQHTCDLIKAYGYEVPDWQNLPSNDKSTLKLIGSGKTTGIFQLESPKMQETIANSQLRSFDDIASVIALYRPGPIEAGMTDDFIAIRNKRKDPVVFHESLRSTLDMTHGLLIYQEQIMRTAEILAGFSLGQGDSLQRAISKKKRQATDAFRAAFLQGGRRKGVAEALLIQVFEIIRKFAGYGFNRSHAVAYAVLTYRTAYLKAHHPIFFYIGLFAQSTLHFTRYALAALADGINILYPCVNTSEDEFTYLNASTVCYGLSFVKGLPTKVRKKIIAERSQSPFINLDDFIYRVFKSSNGQSVCMKLTEAGAFDVFRLDRAYITAYLPQGFKNAAARTKGKDPLSVEEIDYVPSTPAHITKQEIQHLKVSLHKDNILNNQFWLLQLNIIGNINKPLARGFGGRRLYTYAGFLIDTIKLSTLYIHTIQFGANSYTVFDKDLSKLELGELLVIKSYRGMYVNRHTGRKSLYAASYEERTRVNNNGKSMDPFATIECAVQKIVKKQILTVNSKEKLWKLIKLLHKLVLRTTTKPETPVPLEIRYQDLEGQIVRSFRLNPRETVYALSYVFKQVGELKYQFF
jgi:DNA polymerase-3 subunit alpha